MNTAEAGRLLMHAAAFDNRQPSATAAEAWAAALHDLPFDQDGLTAIARYYGTAPQRPGDRLWIQPHDIRTGRAAIRAERLDGFQYEPQPGDDNPAQYLRNLRQQQRAVADGNRPAVAARALPPGRTDRLDTNLVLVGQVVPRDSEEATKTFSPLSVPCPQCGARLGQHCKKAGHPTTTAHAARTRVANGEPAHDPEAEQTAEQRRAAAAAYLERLTPDQRAELAAFEQQMNAS